MGSDGYRLGEGIVKEGAYEPTADMRMLARQLKDMFQALTAEGFTERQALAIIGEVIATGAKGQQ